MRNAIPAVLLAVAVVLAGCNGLALGGDETPTQTLTPAAVPTDEPTPTPVPQLAPGLTGQGVTDVFALAEAHRSVLDGTSYTVQRNSTVRYANRTIYNRFRTRSQHAANRTRFYTVQSGSSIEIRELQRFSRWSNGERVLRAVTSDNRTSYSVSRGPDGEPVSPREISYRGISDERITTLFSAVETRVTGREQRNGTTVYRVVATNVTTPTAFEVRWTNPENLTLVAQIDSQGLVREYRLSYTATVNDSAVRVHRQARYTDLGNTSVERPPWYDAAIENVSTATPAG